MTFEFNYLKNGPALLSFNAFVFDLVGISRPDAMSQEMHMGVQQQAAATSTAAGGSDESNQAWWQFGGKKDTTQNKNNQTEVDYGF